MKWALIYVLASGIWDTGLRYEDSTTCNIVGDVEIQRHFSKSHPVGTTLQQNWLCVPSKE